MLINCSKTKGCELIYFLLNVFTLNMSPNRDLLTCKILTQFYSFFQKLKVISWLKSLSTVITVDYKYISNYLIDNKEIGKS